MYRIAFFLFLTASPVFAAGLERFAGEYAGCAVSGEEWVPITTTLTTAPDGLSGSYVFEEPSGRRITGTLSFLRDDGDNSVALAWSDIYGTGAATFVFSRQATRFDGEWRADGGIRRYPWNGVRTGFARPDCGVPLS